MGLSLLEKASSLSPLERLEWLESLSEETISAIVNKEWWVCARPEQETPLDDWYVWLILAGRGWGKTRTGAEWLIDEAMKNPFDKDGLPTEWGAFAQTLPDARLVMTEGQAGLLNVLKTRKIPYDFISAPMKITLPQGQKIHIRGADDPDAGRGFNLAGAWLDEIAKWRHASRVWVEGIVPSLRILTATGQKPRAVITTTPKAIPLLFEFAKRTDGSVHITRGSTFDNSANLSPAALAEMERRYEGTRIGRQELYGELLVDVEGALWTLGGIERDRVSKEEGYPQLVRIVVGVDPAVTSGESSDHTGIVVAGLATNGHFYVLDDKSIKASPDAWARVAVEAYHSHKADKIVAEANNGGDMITILMRQVDVNVSVKKVIATRGKQLRAEPISSLYEQGRVHHVGLFAELETEMCEWTPASPNSPDRLDALVWAITELMEGSNTLISLTAMSLMCPACGMPNRKTDKICFKCKAVLGE